ncbi:MAG: Rrf2 family transcriptional regulator [Pseudomonadota bacterium]
MLRLSRKTMLALEAVLDVAYNARPDPVQSKDITRRQGIPNRYLEHVMQSFVHHGILKGVRGPKGGYILARERRRITVGDIVRVVEQVDAEAEGEPLSGAALGEQVIHPLWTETRDAVLERLDGITIEDLCTRARKLGIPHGTKASTDFSI